MHELLGIGHMSTRVPSRGLHALISATCIGGRAWGCVFLRARDACRGHMCMCCSEGALTGAALRVQGAEGCSAEERSADSCGLDGEGGHAWTPGEERAEMLMSGREKGSRE
eukprot:362987-Chlamydomonas_euryale.AAC.9